MTDTITTPLRLLPPAARSSRTAPRPLLLTAAGRYDGTAIMRLAHDLAREDVARAARFGATKSYKLALRHGLSSAWETARAHRWCFDRDAALAALPASHAAILNERTAALMIDSGRSMLAEVAAIDARAAALGLSL